MPRDIRVGDKVRLLGWHGEFCGLTIWANTREMVGTEAEVEELDPDDNTAWIRNEARAAWWPVSMLEPLAAPSAWTKTSDGKPEVGVWVLGWWAESGSDLAAQVVIRLCSDGEWRANDGLDTYFAPDYWQPLPAPPEVSK